MTNKYIIFSCLFLIAQIYATNPNVCVSPSICSIGRNDNPLNLDFGDLLKYNIFTSQNFINDNDEGGTNPSDVEGRVVVGGNHRVPLGHSIGEKLCEALSSVSQRPDYDNATCQNLGEKCCAGYDSNNLIVRGSSIWTGGRLYYGGGCIGNLNESQLGHFAEESNEQQCVFGTCTIEDGLTPGCHIDDLCVPADSWWDLMVQKLHNISDTLYGLQPNGATFWEAHATPSSPNGHADYSSSPYLWNGHLWLQPLGNQKLNIFEIDASILKQASSFYWAPDAECTMHFNQNTISDCPFKYKPNPDAHIVINVKANIADDCQISHVNLEILQPFADNIIWNFGQCKNNLKIQGDQVNPARGDDDTGRRVAEDDQPSAQRGMGMYGMILAIDADLYAKGRIDGQVFVENFIGDAQINWLQFDCLNTSRQGVCIEKCENLFGCASKFNVFVFENYHNSGSDVEGRLAAGRTISFANGFSVGDKLFSNVSDHFNITNWNNICDRQFESWTYCDICDECGQAVIVGGKSIESSLSGRVYFGNWMSPDLSKLNLSCVTCPEYGSVSFYGAKLIDDSVCPGLNQSLSDSFTDIATHLIDLSQTLCNLMPTGYVLAPLPSDGGAIGFLRISLFGNPKMEVVFIDGTQLLNAHTFEISQLPDGVTIIFNVFGNVSGFANIDLSALQSVANRVIWNFCEAHTLYVTNVSVWGTILAPYADVIGTSGVIQGQLFANSFNGTTQSNWVPFAGCIETCDTITETLAPTESPTEFPTEFPTESPTGFPTGFPTESPTEFPTGFPTESPTDSPTDSPTWMPTWMPTWIPTWTPTNSPSGSPTDIPTGTPTGSPTARPTRTPTRAPTRTPTISPTRTPTVRPTRTPTISPTRTPTRTPTKSPTAPPVDCTTYQCIVNDACPMKSCKYSKSKSLWFGPAEKVGLSPNFQCNHNDNPKSATRCTFEESQDHSNNKKYGRFIGTLCNDKKREYCLDFDVEFSKYHGPGKKSPYYDMCYDVCRGKCYGDVKSCDNSKCECVEDGKHWDYYETITGTFIAHPGSPWVGLKGVLREHDHLTQRGWGANLFNLQYGLSNWMVAVIEQKPYNKSQLGSLNLGACYSSNFNFDLDECKHLKPKTQCKSKPDYKKCNPQCGVGALTSFGVCINSYLSSNKDYSSSCATNLQKDCEGKCICKDGYTGPHSFYWTDKETGKKYVIADVCDTKCTSNKDQPCIAPEKPTDNGLCFVTKCSIEYVRTGSNQNPWPKCGTEEYNFIGTVEVCSPNNIIVDSNWKTHFFVDNGIIIEQLWSDHVGDWKQENNKVTCNSAQWKQNSPPQCFKIYFRARKPNPYQLKCKDQVSENDNHCGFFVNYPNNDKNNLIHIDFNSHKRGESIIIPRCISVSTFGCFNPNVTNITNPGTNCGTISSRITPPGCPVCPDNNISLLSGNGNQLSDYLTSLEKYLGIPAGSFIVVAIDSTSTGASTTPSIEVYVDTNIIDIIQVIKKLEDKLYQYSIGDCSTLVNKITSDSSKLSVTVLLVTILVLLFFL